MDCISIERLFALIRDQLPAGESHGVRLHLESGCAACAEQLEQLKQVLEITGSHQSFKTPPWLVHQAMNLFTWHTTKPDENNLERFPALLLFDSAAENPLPGFRSLGSIYRQMLYRAGPYSVHLSMNYNEPDQTVEIMGQPIPLSTSLDAVEGAAVKLLDESSVVCATKSNEFGAFFLSRVPGGSYNLKIQLTTAELDITGLDVSLPRRRRLTKRSRPEARNSSYMDV
jgi:hypothetical protein